MRYRLLSASLATALLTLTSVAQAQTTDERTQEARAQFAAGMRARDARRWGEAVLSFERSLRIRVHPQTLFEIANARFRGGDPEGALTVLRDLLATRDPVPSDDLVNQARALAREAGEPNLSPTPERTVECPTCPTCPPQRECPECPPPQLIERTPVVPLALGIGGGVLLGIGAGFYGHALADSASYNSQNASLALRMEIRPRGESFRVVGLLGILAGIGLETTAAVLAFTARPRTDVSATQRATAIRDVRFDFAPDGVSISGRF